MISSYRMNKDPVVRLGVEDLEWKICNQPATSFRGSWLSMQWKRRSQLCCHFNFRAKARAETTTNRFVIGGLRQQLRPRFSSEAGAPHGAIRRASAKTSSAA